MHCVTACGPEDGIASRLSVRQLRHPSRLPSGTLRVALTGPAGACPQNPQRRQCHPLFAALASF